MSYSIYFGMKLLSNQVTFIIEQYIIMPKYKLSNYYSYNDKWIDREHYKSLSIGFNQQINYWLSDYEKNSFFLITDYTEDGQNPLDYLLNDICSFYTLKNFLEYKVKVDDKYFFLRLLESNISKQRLKIIWKYMKKICKINISINDFIKYGRVLNKLTIFKDVVEKEVDEYESDYETCKCGNKKCYKRADCPLNLDIMVNDFDNIPFEFRLKDLNENVGDEIKICYVLRNYGNIKKIYFNCRHNNYFEKIIKKPEFVDIIGEKNIKQMSFLNNLRYNPHPKIFKMFIDEYKERLYVNPNAWTELKTYYTKNVIGKF